VPAAVTGPPQLPAAQRLTSPTCHALPCLQCPLVCACRRFTPCLCRRRALHGARIMLRTLCSARASARGAPPFLTGTHASSSARHAVLACRPALCARPMQYCRMPVIHEFLHPTLTGEGGSPCPPRRPQSVSWPNQLLNETEVVGCSWQAPHGARTGAKVSTGCIVVYMYTIPPHIQLTNYQET